MDIEDIIDKYIHWIKDNTFARKVSNGEEYAITTPFMDTHNDHIDIYAKKSGDNKYILSDDGYTLASLAMVGTDVLSTDKRKKILNVTLNRYGVQLQDNNLVVETDINNIASKKHSLLQALLAVNDMYVMSQENVASFFKEDIAIYLTMKDVYYTPAIKLAGKTGFDHNIDFLIPKSKTKPERLIQALNSPKKENIMSVIFAFNDISAIREEESSKIVIFNDENRELTTDATNALARYDINSWGWSKREEFVNELTLV